MMWWSDSPGWGWMLMGWLWMALFWGAVIGLVVWTVRRTSAPRATGERPLDVLKARYARGEITKEQFQEMRREVQ
jgi:putative membrane protein